jgi:hypothetical protein
LIKSVEGARVVSEDVAVGMVSEVFCELHKAFCVVEHAAREGEAAGRHRGETGTIVHSMVVAFDEPRLNLGVQSRSVNITIDKSMFISTYLVHVLRCEAKLLAYSNSNPSALSMGGLEVSRERLGSIVDGTKPDFEGVAEARAFVLKGDDCLQYQLHEKMRGNEENLPTQDGYGRGQTRRSSAHSERLESNGIELFAHA